MPTEKQLANLQRGVESSKERGADQLSRMREVTAQRDADVESMIETAQESPLQAQKRVYAKLLAIVEKQLDMQLRSRGEPKRILIESTRELRQTADRVFAIIQAEGAAAQADVFFAEMASRLSAANLAEVPRPYGQDQGTVVHAG